MRNRLTLVVIALLACSWYSQVTLSGEAKKQPAADLKKAKYEKARKAYELAAKIFQADHAYHWSRKLYEFERADKAADAADRHVARMRTFLQDMKARYELVRNLSREGSIKGDEVLPFQYNYAAAEYYYLEATEVLPQVKKK